MEIWNGELVGLEPTHVGFGNWGITSFAIAPKIMIFLCIYFYKKSGRGQGIRTLGGFSPAGFQKPVQSTNSVNPLQLNGANGRIELTLRNRNGILSPASTYSATCTKFKNLFKLSLKLDWNYSRFFICQEFLKNLKILILYHLIEIWKWIFV